ncbi:pantoate--beta-alanine ligase [Cohnella endophytica]|uniref:Pantothenate synthetase n=1 Tax=Cohnella endophytica TaxID=2419778 RepID=A0A494YAR8_9BACL|nr:pantoate--beta-alanine ligase [Cohnella endophytica]RKP57022.1 pantoate--beta-alanine ligase [Cohnella endophytica]
MKTNPKIVRKIAELRSEIANFKQRESGKADSTVGFVPTMGYLHDGHASLIRQSATDNGLTVLSIFVNPIQFGPGEDLDKYPRDEERDIRVASDSGADIVFLPSVEEMYPRRRVTTVTVDDVTDRLCGASRPGHFDGVATVVVKLFNIVQPDRAYFGQKDAQQVAVIERMTQDLNIPVEIVPCPILREEDGLALSSRNVYLSPEQRQEALVLSKSLARIPEWIAEGMNATRLIASLKDFIGQSPLADIDYVDVLTYPDLSPPDGDMPLFETDSNLLIAVAVRFGRTRLIDNRLLKPTEVGAYICSAK